MMIYFLGKIYIYDITKDDVKKEMHMKYRAVFSKHNSVINHLGKQKTVVVYDDDVMMMMMMMMLMILLLMMGSFFKGVWYLHF